MLKSTSVNSGRPWITGALLLIVLLGLTAVLGAARLPAAGAAVNAVELSWLGTYAGDGAEISAFDPASERLFVVSGSDELLILDLSDPAMPSLVKTFSVSDLGAAANSVAAYDGLVAVAIEADVKQDPGFVGFYDTDGNLLQSVTAGALPDMITFTPDGQKVVTANEGEPDADYLVDPEGSVTVVDVSGGVAALTQADVTTIGFADFNAGGPRHGELDPDVRIFGPGASVAQDLEPEYVALSSDGQTAWVTLQENNGLAVLNLADNSVTAIKALGTKDWSLPENQLDASDRDTGITITNWPALGLYMPDAIASFEVNGETYLLTANEGDAREYDGTPGYIEESRVEDETLDATAFPNAAELQLEENMGRLKITTASGRDDASGEYTELYAFGARSFSVWSSAGELVYDSGGDIEAITAVLAPDLFNSQGAADSFDSRSDDKGPEPEGVTKGVIDGRTYAFVGLERIGGLMVYDVSDPQAPQFVQYQPALNDDVSPEGLLFVPAAESPNGRDLLVVTYEVSGTTTIFEVGAVAGGGLTYLPAVFSD